MRNIETERLLLTPWTGTQEEAEGLYAYAEDAGCGTAIQAGKSMDLSANLSR